MAILFPHDFQTMGVQVFLPGFRWVSRFMDIFYKRRSIAGRSGDNSTAWNVRKCQEKDKKNVGVQVLLRIPPPEQNSLL